jgi:hypothetical protein
MSLLRQAKNRWDHRMEALLRVINLKTWETKMHIALTAFHDLGTRAFRFYGVRLIGIELFVSPLMQLTHMVPTGHHWHVGGGCKPVPEPTRSWREGLRVQPLTYALGICLWDALGGRLPSRPILVGVDMSLPYRLVPVVVSPLNWNSLELAVPLVGNVRVHEGHLVPPQEQHPPPLDVALEAHDPINKTKLVSNVVVNHPEIVVIQEIPPQEGEVDVRLEGRAPNLLRDRRPGNALAAVGDHVERFLFVA